jgi:hypothetical protein
VLADLPLIAFVNIALKMSLNFPPVPNSAIAQAYQVVTSIL